MSFDAITSLLENFDLTALVPELFGFLSTLQTLCVIAMLIGPLFLLGFGIWYLFWPRQKVGHRMAFCTYYALGSQEAWLYTQKMAGLIWTVLGGGLLVAMGVVCILMGNDVSQVAQTARTCLLWEVVLAVLSWIAICILPAIFFDKEGNRRK